jgi:hydrogenase maturation protease
MARVLVFGYGNPGRLDDGLGPFVAEAIERLALPEVTVETAYQLAVEDAHTISQHEVVVFVDATVQRGGKPFTLERVAPRVQTAFTSHHLDPASALGLAHDLFRSETRGYLLAIPGHEFNDFGECLSSAAQANAQAAVAFLAEALGRGDDSLLAQRAVPAAPAILAPPFSLDPQPVTP